MASVEAIISYCDAQDIVKLSKQPGICINKYLNVQNIIENMTFVNNIIKIILKITLTLN